MDCTQAAVHPSRQVIETFSRTHEPTAGLDLTKSFTVTEGSIWTITKVRCSTFKRLRAKSILIIPITVRPAQLLKANVALTQFPDVWTVTVAARYLEQWYRDLFVQSTIHNLNFTTDSI